MTVCPWREEDARFWAGDRITFPEEHPDPDGSDWLFHLVLAPTPGAFRTFAEDYYETSVNIEAVRHIYDLRPLDRPHTAALNPSAPAESVIAAARTIDCPLAGDLLSEVG
ncbi:hypothetical protein [Streptomyces sp. NBC_00203]|uniref:hypothetical protein n=1 Tax=Streptomyces sp. NBC_00203 TaxID=2975680 RepID=UPI0032548D50